MIKSLIFRYWPLSFLLLLIGACRDEMILPSETISFKVPSNFPPPVYDLSRNPVTPEGFELGRKLFYDGLLSRDGSISCGFCHQQSSGFTQHGHDLSHGIDDKLTKRNALPIQNLAWVKEFFWDGGVFHLDLFAVEPIQNPSEMDESLPNVLSKLKSHNEYPEMFAAAFGSPEITTDRFLKALSQFQLMCISSDSRYDRFVRNEGVTLTSNELAGLELFELHCSGCHSGQLFSDGSYRNNGLPIGNDEDTGRQLITLNDNDKFKFRVPSLRNVEVTMPYMHDGRFRTMEEVIHFYVNGVTDSPTLDPLLRRTEGLGIPLTPLEQGQIIAFLKTLTDHDFLRRKSISEFP